MIILGSGAHAKDVYYELKDKSSVVFYNNIDQQVDRFYNQFKIIKYLDYPVQTQDFHLGVGSIELRQKFVELAESRKHRPTNLINGTIKYDVKLGKGITIFTNSTIGNSSEIADYCLINLDCNIGHNCIIGKHCVFSPMCCIGSYSKIGDNCFLGSNCTILPSIHICSNTIIGAGSVVTKDITESGIYIGNPAKIMQK